MTILFQIPPPTEWMTDQVANVIAGLSAFVTALTLIYLVRQGKQSREDIQKLAGIAEELKEQNKLQKQAMRLSVQPVLVVRDIIVNDEKNHAEIAFQNDGHVAILLSIRANGDNVFMYQPEPLPFRLVKGDIWSFVFLPKEELSIHKCRWSFTVLYEDQYNNVYTLLINGYGLGYTEMKVTQ